MRRLVWLVLPAVATVAACQAKVGDGTAPRTMSGGGSGSSGSGSSSGGASSAPPGGLNLACSKALPGSPVLRLLNGTEFSNTVSDIFPQIKGAWTNTLPANSVSVYGFDNDSSTVVGTQLAQAILDTATSVGTAVTGAALATILPCSATAADRTCASQFVTQYGRRLFRRPLTAAEQSTYLSYFDGALAKSDFKTAIKWLTIGLIQSPNALYRSEIGALASNGTRQLSPDEVAAEFAYTFTGTTPTDALLTQAETGASVDVVTLAKNLLATDPGKLTLQRFFEAYLGYTQVSSLARSNVPNFDTLRTDMVQETRAFINQIVLQNPGGVKELLTAPTTNPSSALAAYYGFPAPTANYASVTRPAGQGIGVLVQGSVLASHAQPDSSSPTKRGLLVFLRLLCNTKPTPPPNVPPLPAVPAGQAITTRQRYETQHALGGCASCHKLFDPIGFGFEHFDEGGKYRAAEGALPIDSASAVPNLDGSALFSFKDEETLVQGLAQQGVVSQCVAAYLATYAFGTGDSCLGASRVSDLKAGTLGIADYYASLAAEPHFTSRNGQ